MSVPKTTLRMAMAWTCDNCGRDQLLETPIREEDGAIGVPVHVACRDCKAKYETEPPIEFEYVDEDEDETDGEEWKGGST